MGCLVSGTCILYDTRARDAATLASSLFIGVLWQFTYLHRGQQLNERAWLWSNAHCCRTNYRWNFLMFLRNLLLGEFSLNLLKKVCM